MEITGPRESTEFPATTTRRTMLIFAHIPRAWRRGRAGDRLGPAVARAPHRPCLITGGPVVTCAASDEPRVAPTGRRHRDGSQGAVAIRGRSRRLGRFPVATPPCHPEQNARRAWSRRISCARDRLSGTQEILRLRGCAPALRMTGESWRQESGGGGRRSGRCDRMSRCCRGVGLPPDPGVEWTNPVMPWAWPPHRGVPGRCERCGQR